MVPHSAKSSKLNLSEGEQASVELLPLRRGWSARSGRSDCIGGRMAFPGNLHPFRARDVGPARILLYFFSRLSTALAGEEASFKQCALRVRARDAAHCPPAPRRGISYWVAMCRCAVQLLNDVWLYISGEFFLRYYAETRTEIQLFQFLYNDLQKLVGVYLTCAALFAYDLVQY